MEYEVRLVTPEEHETYRRALARAFAHDFNPEHQEAFRAIAEFDRNLGTYDNGVLVGTAGIFSFRMAVPGGDVAAAGVTQVTVQPTHRRRGVLTGMMRRQLEQVRERNEPLAILWASESVIYGRFGYGLAIQSEVLRIPNEHKSLRSDLVPAPGRVRLIDLEEAKAQLPEFHERARKGTPGGVGRSEKWWENRIFRDPPDFREGWTSNQFAVYEGDEGLEGYLRYRTKGGWDDWIPKGEVNVEDFFATTREAYVGLWRYVLGVDLMGTYQMNTAASDEPIFWMLKDPRRTQRKRLDAIWLRLVDVEAALSARQYTGEGSLAFEVNDGFLHGAGGRFELEAGPDGAVCRRSTREPELTLGAEELAALYLGGARLESMHRIGRVEGSLEAVARADRLFSWVKAPHCQEHF